MITIMDFGILIKEARKQKGYTQRDLAKKLGIDFTYLSKLENNRPDYAPKEELIRKLADCLDLEENELIFLAGRIPSEDEDLIKQHYQNMPLLFRRMRENPEFATKIFQQAKIMEKKCPL
ncbi:helix-turn-helix transcriptional regulator [Geminocystis sp. GBBB08]|uniref:helix-turn-helix domain-containing protein n=1 Tax=Geminocystis sp. GBBB08 TaxID=2604140 RepID=UPI0027E2D859|nr:helix-turn-helix transcriptional regulator [Geminocystis sp. GBBB08]MBL1209631.1 helix-turn-helix transcriptional regulator [Geminocystis sp. GBBB08]